MTGEVPVAVDLYSKPKEIMDDNWGKSWWNSEWHRFRPVIRDQMQSGKVRFVTDSGFREQSIRKLCPMLEVWKMR